MNKLCDVKYCSGCGACISACNINAIHMQERNGFYYPAIDENVCVNCGLCSSVCEKLAKQTVNAYKRKSFAAYDMDSSGRMCASSGGFFGVLARQIISDGGVVCGAAWTRDLRVQHILVDCEEDLYQLFGSKYVQSEIGVVFKQIKELLCQGKKVLFSGTPCQCDGLAAYVGAHQNLYIVDFICYGIPSPEVFKKYIASVELVEGKKIKKYSFRSKSSGWANKDFSTEIEYVDGMIASELTGRNLFYKAMCEGVITRESCSLCRYKGVHRSSNITIGDLWGIQSVAPDMNDNKGTSFVIVNDEIGDNLWEQVLDKIVYKPVDLNDAVSFNKAFDNSIKQATKRYQFFEEEQRTAIGNNYLNLLKNCSTISLFEKIKRRTCNYIKHARKRE